MSKYERAMKHLGEDTANELSALSETDLRKRIAEANESMRQVDDELEANEKYQEIKESLKAITAGKREVDKRQKAIICVALHLLRP